MAITSWSSSTATNATYKMPENQAPSTVNDHVRDLMADVKTGAVLLLHEKSALAAVSNYGGAIMLDGYYAAGDMQPVTYYWDNDSSATDNAGTIIKPTGLSASAAGRWIATINSGTPQMFGAKADGTTDDSTAIQACLDALDTVIVPDGTYKVNSTLTRSRDNLRLYAENRNKAIFDFSGITDATSGIKVSTSGASVTEIEIDGLGFEGGDAATGAAIELEDVTHCRLTNLVIENYSASSTCRGVWTKGRQTTTFENIRMTDVRTGFYHDSNPNAATLDTDHFIYRNVALNISDALRGIGWHFVGDSNFNVTWDGFQAVQVALHSILVDNGSTSADSTGLACANLRMEQGDKQSIRTASWQWIASGSGTSEYYLQTSGSADPKIPFTPDVIENGGIMSEGTVGSLTAGQWAYGDNDSLGYNTYYVRLTDSADPDSKASNYVELRGYLACINQASSGNINHLLLDNCRASSGNSFAYLRQCQHVVFRNCIAVENAVSSTVLASNSTVRHMIHENFDYGGSARFETTGLIAQKINGGDDGTFEIWDSTQPAFSATTSHKFNQPIQWPSGTTSTVPDVGKQHTMGYTATVTADSLMAAFLPASINGFGIAQLSDSTSGDIASCIFSFDSTVANSTVVMLAQNNAANDTGEGSATAALVIYGAGNTLRFLNNTGIDHVISTQVWFTNPAKS